MHIFVFIYIYIIDNRRPEGGYWGYNRLIFGTWGWVNRTYQQKSVAKPVNKKMVDISGTRVLTDVSTLSRPQTYLIIQTVWVFLCQLGLVEPLHVSQPWNEICHPILVPNTSIDFYQKALRSGTFTHSQRVKQLRLGHSQSSRKTSAIDSPPRVILEPHVLGTRSVLTFWPRMQHQLPSCPNWMAKIGHVLVDAFRQCKLQECLRLVDVNQKLQRVLK